MSTRIAKITATVVLAHVGIGHAVEQIQYKELQPLKVEYTTKIPAAFKRNLPRNSQTRFFGYGKFQNNGNRYAFHFFEIKQKKNDKYLDPGNPFYWPDCVLRVYVERKIHSRLSFQRLQCVHFDTGYFSEVDFLAYRAFCQVAMGLTWLNQDKHQVPILKIDLITTALYDSGTNFLVVFPGGTPEKVLLQGFGYGSDNSTDKNGWGSFFDYKDESGNLVVKTTWGKGNYNESHQKWLRWDTRKFAPVDDGELEYRIESPDICSDSADCQ